MATKGDGIEKIVESWGENCNEEYKILLFTPTGIGQLKELLGLTKEASRHLSSAKCSAASEYVISVSEDTW